LSYDADLPEEYMSENWSKINYIINNKQGNRINVQDAIWYFICNESYPSNSNAQAMITDAEENGSDFIPQEGEIIAIILEGVKRIQRTFIEYIIPEKSENDKKTPSQPSSGGVISIPAINYPPTADATAGEPYEGFTNETIRFDGSRSYDIDGSVVSWKWRFNDETILTGEYAEHIFKEPGNYIITLIVIDNEGETDEYKTTVLITDENNPPEKPSISGPKIGFKNSLYDFSLLSIDPDDNPVQYIIDWGDGKSEITYYFQSGISIKKSHIWDLPGRYTIRVKAYDNDSESDISSFTILIGILDIHDLGYLIDHDDDTKYDSFYNTATGIETKAKRLENGEYVINSNMDEKWDYIYDPVNDELSKYHEETSINYTMLAILLIICPILIIFVFSRKKKNHKA